VLPPLDALPPIRTSKSRRDHEDAKLSKNREEELIFFVLFVGFHVFVVAFYP